MSIVPYRRIWSCMSLDQSGYSLTLTETTVSLESVKAGLVLDRYDKGKPKRLWTHTGDVETRRVAFALKVIAGTVTVWSQQPVESGPPAPWVLLATVHDATYSHGFAGLEGAGTIQTEFKIGADISYVDPLLVKILEVGSQEGERPPILGNIAAGGIGGGIVRPDANYRQR